MLKNFTKEIQVLSEDEVLIYNFKIIQVKLQNPLKVKYSA